MNDPSRLKTALVHHWLVTMRGGEKVLEALLDVFPHADLFTLVCDRRGLSSAFDRARIHTSFLQRLPRPARWYPAYLPLFPMATERLDLTGYDLVISSDAATMKGVRVAPPAHHICYCHTPMRYVWEGYEAYHRTVGFAGRLVLRGIRNFMRRWDFRAAQRVTYFLANSRNVADRIRRSYLRESSVIYPPVDTEYFVPPPPTRKREGFFLVASQLVPYKRVDLAVEAFNRCGKPLVVIGDGPERRRIQGQANSNVRFLGFQSDEVVLRAMQNCRALVFPGEEDFGIVMAEAQACATPVIALGRGGAKEIVTDGATGILFEEQTADSLLNGIGRAQLAQFDPKRIRSSALRFGRARFKREIQSFVGEALCRRRGRIEEGPYVQHTDRVVPEPAAPGSRKTAPGLFSSR
jgi:glycosyltransferase involved in cell wall biosynthesis